MKYLLKVGIIISLLFSSCGEEDTILTKEPYTGSKIRLDGVWIINQNKTGNHTSYFMYSDGVTFYGGSIDSSDLELFLTAGKWNGTSTSSKTNYGVFVVNNNQLKIESWLTSSGPGDVLKTHILYASIINETSFKIDSTYNNRTEERKIGTDTFSFVPFPNKPDSTNTFIN